MPPADGRPVAEVTFHVRFAETDAMGIVHHSNYLIYFEEGRSHFSRARGAPYRDLESLGYSLAVSEIQVRYIAPAHYDQKISVLTWIEQTGSRGITFGYEVLDAETQQVLVTGSTKHICINHQGTVRRIPSQWLNMMTHKES